MTKGKISEVLGGVEKQSITPEDKTSHTEVRVKDRELKVLVTLLRPRIKSYLQPEKS